MSKYIDKEELLESLERKIKADNERGMAVVDSDFIDLVNDATVMYDVDEVVLCKDCKYWQDNNGGYPHPECRWGHGETPDKGDFCSAGEKK